MIREYDKVLVHGVGTYTEGKFKARASRTKMSREYTIWTNLLLRCYSKKQNERYKSYSTCTVCPEWLDFQQFCEWYTTQPNYHEKQPNGRSWPIDKDLTIIGNTEYSPEACYIVPPEVNFVTHNIRWINKELPAGVHYNQIKKTHEAIYKSDVLATGNDIDYLFEIYKQEKKRNIVEVAYRYQSKITEIIFNNMLNFEVVKYPYVGS